jgi:alanine dehydrogenase
LTSGLGNTDEDGNLIEENIRLAVKALLKSVDILCKYAGLSWNLVCQMSEVLVLSASDVRKLASMRDIIGAVEDAFKAFGKGTSKLAPIILTLVDKFEGEHEIKSGYVENYSIGAKIITYYKNNRARGLPSLFGVIVLNDLQDGRPIAIVDGTYITASRTGAAGAVAAKYLARRDSHFVGVIGAGTQGRYQVAALNEIMEISSVKVYDKIPKSASDYVKEMSSKYKFRISQTDTPEFAVEDADIVVTVTPSTGPIVLNDWIREGTHINAIGADSPGKQELDPLIVPRAKVVVDSIAQCVERGEIQTAVRTGLLKKENIYAELSEIVLGRKPGRQTAEEITLFDATGMAVQDITTAYTVYQLAKKRGLGTEVRLD